MTTITNDDWQMLCRDIQHKQEMLRFAENCGVPVPHKVLGWHDDRHLFLNWWSPVVGIGVLPERLPACHKTELISDWEFETACLAYQQERALKPLAV